MVQLMCYNGFHNPFVNKKSHSCFNVLSYRCDDVMSYDVICICVHLCTTQYR